jgi:cation diffusion facilitator CzcD-associated flavoprotein CzcO
VTDEHTVHVANVERPLRVAIIGAGMAGILSAIKLQEAGLDDFAIYEKADRLGGTWRENT